MSELPAEQTGYIGYFDILGFSKSRTQTKLKGRNFLKYCKIIEDAIKSEPNIKFKFFSDSVFLYYESENNEKVINIAAVLSSISFNLLTQLNLLIRGSLSHGVYEIYTDDNGNAVFLGTPIVEAVNLEKIQDWSGIMISPMLIENNPLFKSMIKYDFKNMYKENIIKNLHPNIEVFNYIQKYDRIPLTKDGRIERDHKGFIIVPQNLNPENQEVIQHNLNRIILKLNQMLYNTENGSVQIKIENTLKMVRYMRHDIWHGIKHWPWKN
jgi:hypothetical protein